MMMIQWESFGISEVDSFMFAIDSTGMVLPNPENVFSAYGTEAYPFTDERLRFLEAEDEAACKQASLKMLLASPQRDYLISNKGEKVHTLEGKVVALYIFEDTPVIQDYTNTLKRAYEAKINEKFEVVLIYLTDTRDTFDCTNEETFWKTFKTMPWLALPFKDPNHTKLKRILGFRSSDCDFWASRGIL